MRIIDIDIPIMKNHIFVNGDDLFGVENELIDELGRALDNFCGKIFIGMQFEEFIFTDSTMINRKTLVEEYRLSSAREYHLLKIRLSVSNTENIVIEQSNGETLYINSDDDDYYDYLFSLVSTNIETGVVIIFISLNLAFPGAVTFGKYSITMNNIREFRQEISAFPYQEAYYNWKKLSWPCIEKLSLEKCIFWILKREGLFNGFSKSQMDKAIIALLNVASNINDFPAQLMWTLIALENLYCDEKTNLSERLSVNTEVFLGDRREYKKIVKKIYDTRSKFLHGNLNFSSNHLSNTFDEDRPETLELYECVNSSLMILIATIQKLIKEDRDFLKFEKRAYLVE